MEGAMIRGTMAPILAILVAAELMSMSWTFAQGQRQEPKPTLRTIMQELGGEYLRLTNSLLMEDFKELEESAKAIESHPLPDAIVTAIKNKLAGNFRGFEKVDEQSHLAAANVAKRAAAKDISGAARAVGHLVEGCVSCHKQFRATLRSLSD
jgi:cytochrome c556